MTPQQPGTALTPRMGIVPHYPPHSYGDCIRACVATIINSDSVPHFFNSSEPALVLTAWNNLREHLASEGYGLFIFADDKDPRKMMQLNNPGLPYILLCTVEGGEFHALVMCGEKILHDPSFIKREITGPSSSGDWVFMTIGVNAPQ